MVSDRRYWAIRGATTVEADDPERIALAVGELLAEIERRNGIERDRVVSAHFTVTDDLRSDFPARAARRWGWRDVPMLSTVEVPVKGALARCIRALVHVEFAEPRAGVRHVYLRDARGLNPDLEGTADAGG
ncbi:MAG TPA: chorismate mutase [Gemmatimonadaceae bacterium]|nr:chorismate mutase [Gemmatimonadaceae bacterium]